MILEKIQHHLGLSFLLVLVFTQSIFFLGARASIDALDDLQALFVSPNLYTNIESGQIVDLQAHLYVPEQDQFSWAYFTIASPEQGISMNFSAYLADDDTWQSYVPWDTENWSAGNYEISATAYVYDERGVITDTYISEPKIVYLIELVEYEVALINDPALELSSLIHIVEPTDNIIDIGEDIHVVVSTEGVLNDSSIDRSMRLAIRDINENVVVEDARILDFVQSNTDARQWIVDMPTTNLIPSTEYILRATLAEEGGSIDMDISADFNFSTAADDSASAFVLDNIVYSPVTGSVISGLHSISAEFSPALQDGEEVFARVNLTDNSLFKDLGLVIISEDRQSFEIIWDTAERTGDFDDLIYRDNDLSVVNDYYQVAFLRQLSDGTEETFSVATYQVDNESFWTNSLASPGPVNNAPVLNFSFTDPLDRFNSIKAKVNTVFGDVYPLGVANMSDRNISVAGWNTLTRNSNEQALFPDGDYNIQIYEESADGSEHILHTVLYSVQNGNNDLVVTWIAPEGDAFIGTQVVLGIDTSIDVEEVEFEIKNSENSLYGEIVSVNPSSVHTNWYYAFPIPSDWPSGGYDIIAHIKLYGSTDIITRELRTLTWNDPNMIDYQFAGGSVDLYYNINSDDYIDALEIRTDNWVPADISNADVNVVFIIKDINGTEVVRLDGDNIIPDLAAGKFLANLNAFNLVTGNYTFCGEVFYLNEQIFQDCSPQEYIFNASQNIVQEDLIGTFDVEFFRPEFVYNAPERGSLRLTFSTENIVSHNYFVVLQNIDDDEDVYISPMGSTGDVNIFEINLNFAAEQFIGNKYKVFVRDSNLAILEEKWSDEAPYIVDMNPDDRHFIGNIENLVDYYAQENTEDREINLYLDDMDILRTRDLVIVSTNFFKHLFTPKWGIKIDVQGKPSDDGDMGYVSCSDEDIDLEIRELINESGHAYCWKMRIPGTGGVTQSGDNSLITGALVNGEGTIKASYDIDDDGGRIETSNYRLSFIFGPKTSLPSIGSTDIADEPGENLEVNELDILQERNKEAISFAGELDCLTLGIYDDNICLQFLAMMNGQIDEQCLQADIYEAVQCENYLLQKQVQKECEAEDIIDPIACQDFLLEKYMSTVECRLDDLELCTSILRDKYLNRLVVAKDRQAKISSSTESIIGQVLFLDELSEKLEEDKIETAILPLATNQGVRVLLAKSDGQTVLESADQLTILYSAVIIVDTDADGLSDDMERYYGTDINNPDTDGDGYLDGEEVHNGYNPMGEGILEKDRSTLDKIIESNNSIEQPKKLSDKIEEDFQVELVKNDENKIKLTGVADADTWVTIFLYSDLPLVMTTKTDSSGNWSYDLQNSLVDGSHKVYVTVNDDTGTIVKQSNPLAFLVKSAQAVTADQYFDRGEVNAASVTDSMLWIYVLGAVFLIIFGIIFIFILHRNKNSQT